MSSDFRRALGICAAITALTGCGGLPSANTALPNSVTQVSSTASQRSTSEHRPPTRVTYKLLYSFLGTPDAGYPQGNLIDLKGTLYSTASGGGGSCGCGAVFTITKSGSESVLYKFQGGSDGIDPAAGLVDVNGMLYGTTVEGGGLGCGSSDGCGTVFAITPLGRESVLHRFGGSGDGVSPWAGLISVKGKLYGTTYGGGGSGKGTVFAITRSGGETVDSFDGSNGSDPYASLMDIGGALFGTTSEGKQTKPNSGTVFKITRSGRITTLHTFNCAYGSQDGCLPTADLIDVDGTLYGTTASGGVYGGGTIFAISPSGKETVLHSFGGASMFSSDGANPFAGLIYVNGTLYGTTVVGGAYYNSKGCRAGCGTVFAMSLSPAGETVLHSFGGAGDGVNPWGGLIDVKGTLYGTTWGGGASGKGTVFSLTP